MLFVVFEKLYYVHLSIWLTYIDDSDTNDKCFLAVDVSNRLDIMLKDATVNEVHLV